MAVIHDVDDSLRDLLAAALKSHGDVVISFDAPTAEWASRIGKKPTVNLWLYDIREDPNGQRGDSVDIRDDTGRVIARQPPIRKYELSYLVSAWAGDALAEHKLLAAVLAAAPERDFLPPALLRGALAEWEVPIGVRMASADRVAGHWDLWSALGVPPRSSVEVQVTAPLVPDLDTDIGAPAEQFDLGMGQRQPPPRDQGPTPMGTHDTGKRWPRARIDEGH